MAHMNNIVLIMAILAMVAIVCQANPETELSEVREKRMIHSFLTRLHLSTKH